MSGVKKAPSSENKEQQLQQPPETADAIRDGEMIRAAKLEEWNKVCRALSEQAIENGLPEEILAEAKAERLARA